MPSFGIGIDFGDLEMQRELSRNSSSDLQLSSISLTDMSESDDDLPALLSCDDDDDEDEYDNESMTEELTLFETETSSTLLDEMSDPSDDDDPWLGSSQDDDDDRREYVCPTQFGEPLSEAVVARLTGIMFPGEDPHDPLVTTPTRFVVHRVMGDKHVILDGCHLWEEGELIDSRLLCDPSFQVDRWYWHVRGRIAEITPERVRRLERRRVGFSWPMGNAVERQIVLRLTQSYKGGYLYLEDEPLRFSCSFDTHRNVYTIHDSELHIDIELPLEKTEDPRFNVALWYRRRLAERVDVFDKESMGYLSDSIARLFPENEGPAVRGSTTNVGLSLRLAAAGPISLYGSKLTSSKFTALQRNAAVTRDFTRSIPKPLVVVVHINGQPARALIDTGSLADFVSLNLVEQLKLKKIVLEKPLTIQLSVQGSRSKVNFGVKARFQYQGADYKRYFDVINLQNYDLILGTPFLYQHQVMVGLNSSRLVLGSKIPLEMKGPQVSVLESRTTEIYEDNLERVREKLIQLARPLCSQTGVTSLPPLRAINHTIPLIDESKIYPWRPSRCPEALRQMWVDKKNDYLKSGQWELTAARNTCPMLLIPKPGMPIRLRVVVDLRERNKNTRKLSSPMPDMEGILRRVAKKPYRSIIDGQDAYEQIRVIPDHVDRTVVTTPDGNMVSHVVQQGDCNAPATYQALMNHIFGEFIGVFMDVYLDDIILYSDTLEEHVKHVTTVIEILKKEKLYLSENKLRFLCNEVKILGRIVTDDGIRMDPEKVDRVLNWKVPTNRTLCRGFIGSVGYLADDIHKVRIPMGVLSEASAET